jgi:hypothetical protein
MLADFEFARYSDGTLSVALIPATTIGGWDIRLMVSKRFGAESGGRVQWGFRHHCDEQRPGALPGPY